MMTCQEARLALWPEPGPRAASPEVSEAFAHYAACADCQHFFAVQADLRARVRRVGQSQRAPRELRERVYSALAAERVAQTDRRRRRRVGTLALGALAAAAVVLLVVLGRPAMTPDRLARPFVEEVLRDVPEGIVTAATPERLAMWFAEHIGHAVPVLDIPGAELTGGRIAYLGGVRSAAVHYRMHGLPLIYFIVPGQRLLGRTIADGDVVTPAAQGFEVVIWGEPGAVHAVAAPMRRDELLAIAEECRRKLRGQAMLDEGARLHGVGD